MCGRDGNEEHAEGLLSACCNCGRKGRAPASVLRLAARGHCSGDDHTRALDKPFSVFAFRLCSASMPL